MPISFRTNLKIKKRKEKKSKSFSNDCDNTTITANHRPTVPHLLPSIVHKSVKVRIPTVLIYPQTRIRQKSETTPKPQFPNKALNPISANVSRVFPLTTQKAIPPHNNLIYCILIQIRQNPMLLCQLQPGINCLPPWSLYLNRRLLQFTQLRP